MMAEPSTTSSAAGDPLDDLQAASARTPRQHQIVLCCAHSVVSLVEEVARNLEGLGFPVEVVCGAEARTALLGRPHDNAPTIYVVCVQGTLKEQVLRPLRQALAAHGGPNQHLFVAVLDLALPLAMVGQIRRFAEALERPGRRGRDGLGERRQWREHLGPHTVERVPTRSYRALEVAERSSPPTASSSEGPRRTGPQTVIGTGRPAKVGVTSKYRAVTGQLPTTDDAEVSGTRPKRKARAPKVRVKAVGKRVRKTPLPQTIEPELEAKGTVIVTPLPAIEALQTPPPPAVPAPRESASARSEAALLVDEVPPRRWPYVAIGAVAVAGMAAWQLGMFGGASDRDAPPVVAATKSPANAPSAAPLAKRESPAAVATTRAPTEPEPTPVEPPSVEPPSVEPARVEPPSVEPAPAEAPPIPPPSVEPVAESPTPAPTSDEQATLAAAHARHRVHTTAALWVSPTLASAVTWSTARRLCEELEIDGVGGFRLPYRRELVAVDVAGYLGDGPHWSRTVDDSDVHSAYVLHPSTGTLTVWLKAEAASVVCVHTKR